jgi:signal transduction histidine kinase
MMFKSIRSRLALSFAGIALVTALALGVMLLTILRNYYSNQELDYLRGNAKSVSAVVAAMMTVHPPHDQVQSQIENLAFLTQTHIRVYALDEQLLYDSGSPENVSVNFGVMKQTLIQTNDNLSQNKVFISVGDSQTMPAPISSAGEPGSKDVFVFRTIQAGGSAYGFALKLPGEAPLVTERSNQKIMAMMLDPKNNQKVGSVELSEGPAYGSAILTSVARGWAFASGIAICLAALIGWYISRRISAPVLALTDITARMTQGNLSSRADVKSRDEFGQLARSFNEMAEQVEQTVSTLREFVADAAHELHTPLTALQANIELARDEKKASDRIRFLSRAQEQGQRLEALVKSLLDLSRIEAAESKSDFVPVDLSQLVRELGEQFASRAEQTDRTFTMSVPDAFVSVLGNEMQLKQVVINLLENAFKFTPVDGTISLTLAHSVNEITLTISDSGIGIPFEDLSHLFERFHRGRNVADYSGNGLGLAIVKAIINLHQGNVVIQSEVGQGTVVSVSVPIMRG